jgi:hypothetical protein
LRGGEAADRGRRPSAGRATGRWGGGHAHGGRSDGGGYRDEHTRADGNTDGHVRGDADRHGDGGSHGDYHLNADGHSDRGTQLDPDRDAELDSDGDTDRGAVATGHAHRRGTKRDRRYIGGDVRVLLGAGGGLVRVPPGFGRVVGVRVAVDARFRERGAACLRGSGE